LGLVIGLVLLGDLEPESGTGNLGLGVLEVGLLLCPLLEPVVRCVLVLADGVAQGGGLVDRVGNGLGRRRTGLERVTKGFSPGGGIRLGAAANPDAPNVKNGTRWVPAAMAYATAVL
jgi:hypothetical protein